MQFNLVYSERGDSGIKCNNLYLSWQTVLKNLRLEKITLDLRMTWIDCDFNRWMQHLLSEYREEDVVDEVAVFPLPTQAV